MEMLATSLDAFRLDVGRYPEQLNELLNSDKSNQMEIDPEKSNRLVYGLRGIRNLFGVSHATASRYKNTIISEAVMQHGRKIIVDVDKALELFKNSRT